MFHVFAANRVPLTECHQFLLAGNRSFRDNLLSAVREERVRDDWREIEELPRFEKATRFESSRNRVQRFFVEPAVENLFAAEDSSLDFSELFDRGKILVANLELIRSRQAQALVGTILVNAIYHGAKRRPRERRRHWLLAIDEFPQFVTSDVANGLDELRKFGVRLILAHQRLAQIPEDLLSAVLTNAKIRAVFGGLSRADAEILARELFTGEVRGSRVKHITTQTKFRPQLTEREIESYSEAESDADADSDGWSEGTSSGSQSGVTDSSATRTSGDLTDETVAHASSSLNSSSSSRGSSGSRSRSHAKSSGRSRSTQFVTEHEEFQEETNRQFWPLDEQWEKLVGRIMNLERREALIKGFNRSTIDIATPEIKHAHIRRRLRSKPGKPRRTQTEAPKNPEVLPSITNGLPGDFHE
jgi:hypothetical protein